MKIKVAVSDVPALMQAEFKAAERAATQGMRATSTAVKDKWRGQVVTAGLGNRLARTVRGKVFPQRGESITPAALVYTKAAEIMASHVRGGVIRSRHGAWLVIPTPAAGKGRGGAHLTPRQWEQRRGLKLRFIYRRHGASLLVAEKARLNKGGVAVASRSKTGRGQVSAAIFILVPQVRLKKRLDLERLAATAQSYGARAIVSHWKDLQ